MGIFLACGGSGGGGGAPPAGDLTVVSCGAAERKVGTACVANKFFDDVLIPSDDAQPPVDVAPDGTRYVRGVLLVSLADESTRLDDARQLFARYGGDTIGAIAFAGFYMVSFSDAADLTGLDAKMAQLAADPAVRAVNRDIEVDSGALAPERPADTDLEKLTGAESFHDLYDVAADAPIGANGKWAYESVGLPRAWNTLYTQNYPLEHVVVGILDGKVERERFPFLVFAGARDRRPKKTESNDSSSVRHGTAVASIIAGPNGDGGMTGYLGGLTCLRHDLAPTAVIENTEAELTREEKRLRTDAIFWGIVYSVQSGARVVNLSLGHTGTGDWRFNIARTYRLVMGAAPDTLFVIGAGNDDTDASFYVPCSAARLDEETKIDNAICVGAIDESGARAVWGTNAATGARAASNYDSVHGTVAIAAPGTRVLATLPDGRMTMFLGTSAATPMVSGAAALLFGVLPGLDGGLAKKILLDSAQPLGDQSLGGKRLDAAAAVEKALSLAAQLHPERVGKGDCRTPDVDTSVSTSTVCKDLTRSCFFCGAADYNVTFTTKPDNNRSGSSEPNRTVASFSWENETTLERITLEVFSFEGSLRIDVPNPTFDPPVIKGNQRPGAIDIQVTGPWLGVITPKFNQTFTDDAGVTRSFSEVVQALELEVSDTGGKLTGTVTAHGDLGGTFTATMKEVTYRESGGCE
ncbi:MAG: S8 family serine peptidase [Labilithrix sp.]|nr:S8 family serine peptidase [Labilithrix sp.]MCW5817789.1 S8 family serine peptidase [Labilithrix sp.]